MVTIYGSWIGSRINDGIVSAAVAVEGSTGTRYSAFSILPRVTGTHAPSLPLKVASFTKSHLAARHASRQLTDD